ncbi:CoA transferase [Siminovitchia terrae]|uniref:CoA transferase n=1 Tax=Siminovitchia terrae TaxID=1914933 RepID=A0A429XCC3_SIMTE|nr:CaiB/BaiF CoA-transferase family protein [Siminovitchia terrae]RST61116.1 CoA transferase [Siminovitchia terrae]
MLPLKGITVVALEQAIAVPFATRQLADLGARVIKIERPVTGDFARNYDTTVNGLSSHFVWCNRSKESIVLDLKNEKDKEAFNRLLEIADVFIQNLAPGALERMGYEPKKLIQKHPKLIICSLSGYGSGGLYQNKKAYDLLIQCESGLVSITGSKDTPSKAGISIADIAGGMYVYSGVLTALLNREKSGEGTILEVSMLEALGEWMSYPMYYAAYGGKDPERTGASHSTIYPYGSFACKEGKKVFLGIQNEREWASFCEHVLKKTFLVTDARFMNNTNRSKNREELKGIIENQFKEMSIHDVISKLEKAKIANARLNTMKDFFEHPQLEARERWRTVKTTAGSIAALIPPVTMEGFEPAMDSVPSLGEHTDAILTELGLSSFSNE